MGALPDRCRSHLYMEPAVHDTRLAGEERGGVGVTCRTGSQSVMRGREEKGREGDGIRDWDSSADKMQ